MVSCLFYNNSNGAIGIRLSPHGSECQSTSATITLMHVTIYNTMTANYTKYNITTSISVVTSRIITVDIDFTNVSFISNNYLSYHGQGGALSIKNEENCDTTVADLRFTTILTNCTFYNNTAFKNMLSITQNVNDEVEATYSIRLSKCNFDSNFGGESIVYIQSSTSSAINIDSLMILDNSTFITKVATALYLIAANFLLSGNSFVLAVQPTVHATAIYFERKSTFYMVLFNSFYIY